MNLLAFITMLIISLAAIGTINSAAEEIGPGAGLIVGALEHHHIQCPSWGPSSFQDLERKYKFQVRVLFTKHAGLWVAFKDDASTPEELSVSSKYFPEKINWYVAFAGKTLGLFKSTVPRTVSYYADIGLHIPDPNAKLPTVGKLTREFSGWPDEPCLRPLVLVSRNNTSDPQHWKPVQPPKPILKKCVEQFRESVGPITFCENQHWQAPTTDYPDNAIRFNKSYQSNDGQHLVSIEFDESARYCEEPRPETGCRGLSYEECITTPLMLTRGDIWGGSWFHVNKDGAVSYIGRGLTLLDAGDYDINGESEVIFWLDGYNKNGYVLYYNNFSNHVAFTWNYH